MRYLTAADRDRMCTLAPLAQAGDDEAREELGELALVMAWYIIGRDGWFAPGMELQDLAAVGAAGIMKELSNWRPDKSPFSAYALMVASADISQAVRQANRVKQQILNGALSIDDHSYRDKAGVAEGATRQEVMRPPDTSGLGRDPGEQVGDQYGLLLEELTRGASALERAALNMCLIEGRPLREAAKVLGRNVKAIDNAIQRVKQDASQIALRLIGDERFSPDLQRLIVRLAAGREARRGRDWRNAGRMETAV